MAAGASSPPVHAAKYHVDGGGLLKYLWRYRESFWRAVRALRLRITWEKHEQRRKNKTLSFSLRSMGGTSPFPPSTTHFPSSSPRHFGRYGRGKKNNEHTAATAARPIAIDFHTLVLALAERGRQGPILRFSPARRRPPAHVEREREWGAAIGKNSACV